VTNPSIDPKPEPATTRLDDILTDTEVGSVFVSNYPPYSFWSDEHLDAVSDVLDTQPGDAAEAVPDLGLYLHIPFCRKRCKFCYFRVYTDKNASQIQSYLDAVCSEIELYSQLPRTAGRPLKFVYFGGGTPSYISARHLRSFVERITAFMPWSSVEEITFECEPGTLTEAKLEAIREIGVTRLSLGVENLNDEILAENGRAHLAPDVDRVLPWIQKQKFQQVNVDLIAGMTGESWERWRDTVARTTDLGADSITVYQMELPYNTVFSKSISEGKRKELILADWDTKRQWHAYAFDQFAAAGYQQSSAYTMVKDKEQQHFVYRDALWRGADMIGTGVASFSHLGAGATGSLHYQNSPSWDGYLGALAEGRLPIERALPVSPREELTRQMILQLKLGRVETAYFKTQFGIDITEQFSTELDQLRAEGMLDYNAEGVRLTPTGLLRVDQLLPLFYDERHRNSRYT